MTGIIEGGWEYVMYAWGLSIAGIVAYATMVSVQLRAAQRRAAQGRGEESP